MKVLIIGGVAAGMSAAAKLRRLDKDAIIHVYEKGSDLSYSACGMPYYLGDIIKEEHKLIARYKKDFEKDNIHVFLNHEVIYVNPENNTISVVNQITNQVIVDNFDKLLIATGTTPYRTNVPGSDRIKIYELNQLIDVRILKNAIKYTKSVAIIGGGYIGVELAENLSNKGILVYLIERNNQLLDVYDFDFAKKAQQALEAIGTEIHLDEEVQSYELSESKTVVRTNKNKFIVDFVIETIGVKPNTEFLNNTGIKTLPNGAIIVNNHMETSIKNIYAAGDCVAYHHLIKDEDVFVPLGTHANKTGRVVAENIAGISSTFPGIVGSNIIKIANLTLAKTGIGLDEASKLNFNYKSVDVTTKNQSDYYPGAKDIFIRLTYEPLSGVLKGAQLIGEKGISDRINIMALAISQGLTAKEFSQLDFAYSPPFSSVWDALQIATNQIKV